MKILKVTLKSVLSIVLAVSIILACTAVAGATNREAIEIVDVFELRSTYLNPSDNEKELYPNGAMMLPVNNSDLDMKKLYAVHVFRQGGLEGEVSITLSSIDLTAEYGNDYRIYKTNNSFASPVPGKANPYYGVQDTAYIPVITKAKTEYLGGETEEELMDVQDLSSQSNDENIEKFPKACSLDVTFEDGENDKVIYVETLQSSKITDDKSFMLSLSKPDGCKIGQDITATYTIKETREKPKAYIEVLNSKTGTNSEKAYVKVQRRGNLGGTSSFYFNTVSDTSVGSIDYENVARNFSFYPGISQLDIPVTVLKEQKDGNSFKAEITNVENAEVVNDKAVVTFCDGEIDEVSRERDINLEGIDNASQYVKSPDTPILNLSVEKNDNKNIATTSKSTDNKSTGDEEEQETELFYKSKKHRGIRYFDLTKFEIDSKYAGGKCNISGGVTKELLQLNSDHGFSFYNHSAGIVSTVDYDFTGVEKMHLCIDPMSGSVSGDYGSVFIGNQSPIGDSDGSWMSDFEKEGSGIRWGLWNFDNDNDEYSFTLNENKRDVNKVYFDIHRSPCPGDCHYKIKAPGDQSDLKYNSYIQMQKYRVQTIGAQKVELIRSGKLQECDVVSEVSMIDLDSSSSSGVSTTSQQFVYRDETITFIAPSKNESWHPIIKGVYFCNPDNTSEHSELYSLSSLSMDFNSNVIHDYESYFKYNETDDCFDVKIKLVFDMPKSKVSFEKSSPNDKHRYEVDIENSSYNVYDSNNVKVATVTFSNVRDNTYKVGDEIQFNMTLLSGDEFSTSYYTRSSDTEKGLATAIGLEYSSAEYRINVPVTKQYMSITPKTNDVKITPKLIVKNIYRGTYSGKGQKYERITGDNTAEVFGYIDENGSEIDFNKKGVGSLLSFHAKASSDLYYPEWSYTDSVTHEKKTYYGNSFFYIVQNPYCAEDSEITLNFKIKQSAAVYELCFGGNIYQQKGTIVKNDAFSEEYEPARNTYILMDDISDMTDENGYFELFRLPTEEYHGRDVIKLPGKGRYLYRALVIHNNQPEIVDVLLSNKESKSQRSEIKLSYKSSGVRPLSITATDENNGINYSDVITLVSTYPTAFDLRFSRENEVVDKPVDTVKWIVENAAGSSLSEAKISVNAEDDFCIYRDMISEIAHPGDKLFVELLHKNPEYSEETKDRQAEFDLSYGKYDTGYTFTTPGLQEMVTYMPDIGVYSPASEINKTTSTGVVSSGSDDDDEPRSKEIPCLGAISPMVSLFGFQPVISAGFVKTDEQGRDIETIVLGISYGQVYNIAAENPQWATGSLEQKRKYIQDTMDKISEAYNDNNKNQMFGGGKALNLQTSVKFSLSLCFCFETYYYRDNDTGNWNFVRSQFIIGGGGSVKVTAPFVILYIPCFVFFEVGVQVNAYVDFYPDKDDGTDYLTIKELCDRKKARIVGSFHLKPNIELGLGIGIDGIMSASGSLNNKLDIAIEGKAGRGIGKYTLEGKVKVQFLILSGSWSGYIVDGKVFFDTRDDEASTGVSNSLGSIYNEEDIMKHIKLGDMEVEKTEISKTEEEIASVGASNGVDEQVLFTTQNKDRINFVDMNNGSYMITTSCIENEEENPTIHYALFDKETKTSTKPVKLFNKLLEDADIDGSNIDKELVNKYKDFIDMEATLTNVGDDVLLAWNKCTNNSKSNIEKIKSLNFCSVMYNKNTGNFHDFEILEKPETEEEFVFVKPKVVYSENEKTALVYFEGIDLTGVTDETTLDEINTKDVTLYEATKDLSGSIPKWTKPISVFQKESRISYFDVASYNDKIYLAYVATDNPGFTLEPLDEDTEYTKGFDPSKYDTRNAMYIKELELDNGQIKQTRVLQFTDQDEVAANPKLLRVNNGNIDNLLIFYKSNGQYAYQNLNSLIGNAIFESKDGILKIKKGMMKPQYIGSGKDHVVNDDFTVLFNPECNSMCALYTVNEGKQRQIWASKFDVEGVETLTKTTVLDEDGNQVYDEHGNAVMRDLDVPIKYFKGEWSGKNYLTHDGINGGDTGKFKESFKAQIMDNGELFVIYNTHDYKFIPSKEDPEMGDWVPVNVTVVASKYDLSDKFELPTSSDEIEFSNNRPTANETIDVTMKAKNVSIETGKDISFNLYVNDKLYDTQEVSRIVADEQAEVISKFTMPKDKEAEDISMYYTVVEDGKEKAKSKEYFLKSSEKIDIVNAKIEPKSYYSEDNDKNTFVLSVDVVNNGNTKYEGGDILKFIDSDSEAIANVDKDDSKPCYTDYGNTVVPELEAGEKKTIKFESKEVPESIFNKKNRKGYAELQFLLVSKDDKEWTQLYANDKFTQISQLYTGPTQKPVVKKVTGINANDVNVIVDNVSTVSTSLVPLEATGHYDMSYEIADESIATVDENGLVKGIKAGETTLKISCESFEKEVKVTVENPLGDADMDGQVTIVDAMTIQKYLAHLISEDKIDIKKANVAGDYDEDGKDTVTIISASLIQKYLANIIKEFPVEKK